MTGFVERASPRGEDRVIPVNATYFDFEMYFMRHDPVAAIPWAHIVVYRGREGIVEIDGRPDYSFLRISRSASLPFVLKELAEIAGREVSVI